MSKNILRNYLYAFFKDFSFFSAVLVPFFTDWGHISLFQVTIIQAWFSLWVFILEVPTGAVADKIGRKHSIALGSLIVAIALLVYGSIPNFGIFLLAEFLFAIGYALTSGADDALLYDTLKSEGKEDQAKKVLGNANALHLLGMSLAAPIGSLIAANFGLNAPTLMSAIPLCIASVIGWSIPEPKFHSEGSEIPRYREIIQKGFSQIRHHPVLRSLAIDSVLVSASAYFIIWFYQPTLQKIGVPISYFGYVHVLLLVTQIAISSNFTLFEKFLGKNNTYLKSSALLTSLSFLLVVIYPHIVTVIIWVMVGSGFGLTRSTYIVGLASKHIDSRARATVLSSIGMLRRLSLVVLNPLVGFIATRSLSTAVFLIGLLPLAALFITRREEERAL